MMDTGGSDSGSTGPGTTQATTNADETTDATADESTGPQCGVEECGDDIDGDCDGLEDDEDPDCAEPGDALWVSVTGTRGQGFTRLAIDSSGRTTLALNNPSGPFTGPDGQSIPTEDIEAAAVAARYEVDGTLSWARPLATGTSMSPTAITAADDGRILLGATVSLFMDQTIFGEGTPAETVVDQTGCLLAEYDVEAEFLQINFIVGDCLPSRLVPHPAGGYVASIRVDQATTFDTADGPWTVEPLTKSVLDPRPFALVRLDEDLSILWGMRIDGELNETAIAPLGDGLAFVTSHYDAVTVDAGGPDELIIEDPELSGSRAVLLAIDASGLVWHDVLHSALGLEVAAMELLPDGGVAVAGTSFGELTLGEVQGAPQSQSGGIGFAYLASYSATGQARWIAGSRADTESSRGRGHTLGYDPTTDSLVLGARTVDVVTWGAGERTEVDFTTPSDGFVMASFDLDGALLSAYLLGTGGDSLQAGRPTEGGYVMAGSVRDDDSAIIDGTPVSTSSSSEAFLAGFVR